MRCETCGAEIAEAKDIKAHEDWEYDTSRPVAVAKLARISLVCWYCHSAEHFMQTLILVEDGKISWDAVEKTIEHFCQVNQVDRATFERDRERAFAEWTELSALEWNVDYGKFSDLVSDLSATAPKAKPKSSRDGDARRRFNARVDGFMQELTDLCIRYGIWIGRTAKKSDTPLHLAIPNDVENDYTMTFSIPLDAWNDPESTPHTRICIRWSKDPINKPMNKAPKGAERTSAKKKPNAKRKRQ